MLIDLLWRLQSDLFLAFKFIAPHTFWIQPKYIVILLVAAGLFYAVPKRIWQNLVLLGLGTYYAWHISRMYAAILFVSGFLEWMIARRIYQSNSDKERYRLIWISVGMNASFLLLLVMPLDHFIDKHLLALISDTPTGRLLGSLLAAYAVNGFFLFSKMTLSLDAYYRRLKDMPSLLDAMAFTYMFTRLWGNPMDRARDTLPQMAESHRWNWARTESALWLILFGVGKFGISSLFGGAPQKFLDLDLANGFGLYMGAWIYVLNFWLYFSGTIEISRGLALMFGISIPRNFDAPLLSTNIADFWRRWNIMFGNWLYEEIFAKINFALRKLGNLGIVGACLGTFLISGVAHGIGWSVLTWTSIQGGSILVYFIFRPKIRKFAKKWGYPRIVAFLGWLLTVHLFVLPLGLGSYGTLPEILRAFSRLVEGPLLPHEALLQDIPRCLALCLVAMGLQSLPRLFDGRKWICEQKLLPRIGIAVTGIVGSILCFGVA